MRKVGKLQGIVVSVVVLLGCSGADTETTDQFSELALDSTDLYLRQPARLLDTNLHSPLKFTEVDYDFGRVRAGRTVRHRFTFTNTGPGTVRITDVATSCGCTVSRYPTEPIDPGARAAVEVIFTTRGSTGQQRRPVVVQAGTRSAQTTLYLSGEVIP